MSPLSWWKVKPGLYDFANSDYTEDNLKSDYADLSEMGGHCYVGHICTMRVTLKDSYGNLMD